MGIQIHNFCGTCNYCLKISTELQAKGDKHNLNNGKKYTIFMSFIYSCNVLVKFYHIWFVFVILLLMFAVVFYLNSNNIGKFTNWAGTATLPEHLMFTPVLSVVRAAQSSFVCGVL